MRNTPSTFRLIILLWAALSAALPSASAMPPRTRLVEWAACLTPHAAGTGFRASSPARPAPDLSATIAEQVRRPLPTRRTRVIHDHPHSMLVVVQRDAQNLLGYFAIRVIVRGGPEQAEQMDRRPVLAAGFAVARDLPRWGYPEEVLVDYSRRAVGLVHHNERTEERRVTEMTFNDLQVYTPAVVTEVSPERDVLVAESR